ncbi:MAG: hypothetical protein B7C24_09995 [Bacteroidetes bacterium 4572_77]|nr:MAG: hypothetical protein B7C24_09995 [Bacteroidetes bacterium 4572_77]
MLFNTAKSIIIKIDEFMDAVEQGILVFKAGVNDYIINDEHNFQYNFNKLAKLENKADELRRSIENELIVKSLLPAHHVEILELIDKIDDIIDIAKENLSQFDAEVPMIPEELNNDLIRLTDASIEAAEQVIPACRAIFTDPNSVREKLNKVYFYEKETDKLAIEFKRKVFREMPDIKLSEKFHLRYFCLHIESISDKAEQVADLLTSLSIKFRI